MKYQVIVAERAKNDLHHYFAVATERAPETAIRWLERFEKALETLATNPEHCGLAPENELVDRSIYQFFYGKRTGRYRVLFTITNDRVVILHVRRGSMDKAAKADLQE